MDYEKKYKEALERAKEIIKCSKNPGSKEVRMVLSFFPELRENEDERIRKELLDIAKTLGKSEWIVWLEKQGEPKEINPSEFDSQLNRLLGQFKSLPKEELASSLSFYLNVVQNDGTYKEEKQGEQKPVPDWMPKFLDELRSKKNYFDWDEHKDIEGGILAIINWMNPNYFNEKDGKQKADKVEPKFREGDMIIHKELGGDYIHSPHKIIQVDILDKKYRLEGGLVAHFGEQDDYELVEQKPAWSEEDETTKNNISYIIRQYDKISKRENKPCWYIGDCLLWMQNIKDKVQPQPKQDSTDRFFEGFKKGEQSVIENYGKYGLCKVTKWSEEDEDMINSIIRELIHQYNEEIPQGTEDKIKWLKNRLKSLRPQSTWKPSDEQMEAIRIAYEVGTANDSWAMKVLKELYKELRKSYYD